jgi:hypothetical protein
MKIQNFKNYLKYYLNSCNKLFFSKLFKFSFILNLIVFRKTKVFNILISQITNLEMMGQLV